MSQPVPSSGFRFYAEPYQKLLAQRPASTLVATVPSGVNSKTQLLQQLARELRFPAYFGENWDALADCLNDFSWLDSESTVRLVHEAIPFPSGWKKRSLYLRLLRHAIQSWNDRPGIRFEVYFPESARGEVDAAMTAAG